MFSTLVELLGYPGFVLLGIALLAAIALVYRPQAREPDDEVHLILTVAARSMIGAGFVGASMVLLSAFGIVFAVAGLFVVVHGLWRYRASQELSLLKMLATATTKSIPLPAAIEAFAHEWKGPFGLRIRRLAELLARGIPLTDALRRSGRLLPPRSLVIIETGAGAGALAEALAEATEQQAPREPLQSLFHVTLYLAWLTLVLQGMLIFLSLRVFPAYAMICADFGKAVPAPTAFVMQFSDYVLGLVPIAFIAGLLLVAVVFSLLVARRLDSAAILRSLSVVAGGRRPMTSGISVLASHFPRPTTAHRLRKVLAEVEAGQHAWHDSLRRHGLIGLSELALLQSAEQLGNLDWALREAADVVERKLARRMSTCLKFVEPVLLVAMGTLVASVTSALLVPMVELTMEIT